MDRKVEITRTITYTMPEWVEDVEAALESDLELIRSKGLGWFEQFVDFDTDEVQGRVIKDGTDK